MKNLFPLSLFALILLAACSRFEPADFTITPGPGVQERLQEALILVPEGGVVALEAGRYQLTESLSLDRAGVTLRGAGRHETVLVFANMEAGSGGEALIVTSDNVTLKDFAIEDPRGDGVKAKGVKNIRLQSLRVTWTGGPDASNGAYGLYPVESDGVLIEHSEVSGASDAGIYVGQSRNIVVRDNEARFNVAGIEIENSFNADVYGNVATRNTAGILVFDLPNLPQKGGSHVRVYDNKSFANDTPNFAKEGAIVASTPVGIGMLIMANHHVDVFDNHLYDNSTAGIVITSYSPEHDDADYYPHPEAISIRGNTFGRTGWAPDSKNLEQPVLMALAGRGAAILWDGVVADKYNGILPNGRGIYIADDNRFAESVERHFFNVSLALQGGDAESMAPHKTAIDSPIEGSGTAY